MNKLLNLAAKSILLRQGTVGVEKLGQKFADHWSQVSGLDAIFEIGEQFGPSGLIATLGVLSEQP